LPHQVLDERRLSLLLDSKGIVKEAGASPSTLFGFDPKVRLTSNW
jgi:hypothetical protein